MRPTVRSLVARYAVAILAVVVALLGRLALDPLIGDRLPFLFFALAVAAVAWHGGLGPSLLALLLGLLACAYFFLEPRYSLVESVARSQIQVTGFLFLGVTIGLFSQALRAARRRAESSAGEANRRRWELEQEVLQRKRLELELQRRAEELAQADRRKDEFLAMLGHELRNPLGPIRNAVGVMRLLGLGEPQLVWARDVIDRQVVQLARLVDDLLDVSRISRGKIVLQTERLDLAGLVRNVVEDCRRDFDDAGLCLALDLGDTSVWVDGDRARLTQVMTNLLQNSLKFTERGGQVSIRVETAGQWAILRVRDTGVGIDPEMLPRLFETFAQADRSLDRSKGGLGLGLALVKGLVSLHGGEVSAFSGGRGQGAEFVVKLPLESDPAIFSGPRGLGAGDPASAARKLRILVVEDNHDAAESLRLLLELFGCEVAVAHSGPAGVEAATAWRPEVVLCDIGLPGMSGYEVVAALRRHPATATARLIALTGYGQEEDRRRSREAGFDQHLVKPVDPATLREVLTL
jgi:signal transduction histidine kinase